MQSDPWKLAVLGRWCSYPNPESDQSWAPAAVSDGKCDFKPSCNKSLQLGRLHGEGVTEARWHHPALNSASWCVEHWPPPQWCMMFIKTCLICTGAPQPSMTLPISFICSCVYLKKKLSKMISSSLQMQRVLDHWSRENPPPWVQNINHRSSIALKLVNWLKKSSRFCLLFFIPLI